MSNPAHTKKHAMTQSVSEIEHAIKVLLIERENLRVRQREIARRLHALRVKKARHGEPSPDVLDEIMLDVMSSMKTTS